MIPASVNLDSIRLLATKRLPAPLPPIVIRAEDLCLKKLKIHADMSEETDAFSAEVWFRKKLIAYAKNDGRGGSTFIQGVASDALGEAEAWAKALPPESSYHRVYVSMEHGEKEFVEARLEDINGEFWATTSSVNLESLVDDFVAKAAFRKRLKGLKSYVILGPRKNDIIPIGQAKYKSAVTPEMLARDKLLYGWACQLIDVIDLPYHYYPSPHPFSGLGYPDDEVVIRGRVAKVCYDGTGDRQVAARALDDTSLTLLDSPDNVKFVEDIPGAAELVLQHARSLDAAMNEKVAKASTDE